MSIDLVTLGELRCQHNGADTDLPKQKLRFALLVYLGMERSAPREKVAALLWPDVNEERARHRLNQSIYALRQTFGTDCIETKADELRATDTVIVDARDFGALADEGDFENALALYHRPFLDGFYIDGADEWERWVDRRRAVLARTYAHAARSHINTLIERRQYDPAIHQLTRWLELDEHSEDAHRLFLLAMARAGRRDDALTHFAAWQRQLRDEGLTPADSLKKLAEEIRTGAVGPIAPVAQPVFTEPSPTQPAPVAPPAQLPTAARQVSKRMVLRAGALITTIAIIGWLALDPITEYRFRTAELDSMLYVVFPFNYEGEGNQPLYEQQVIAEALSGWEGIAIAQPVQVRAALARVGYPLDLATARDIARQLKAGRFFLGEVSRTRNGQQTVMAVYDTRTGRVTGTTVKDIRTAAAADSLIAAGVDELVFGRATGRRFAAYTATSSALARLAMDRGLQAVEQWDLVAADSFFFQAMQHDAQFAQAALWLAQIRSWKPTPSDPAEWRFAAQRAAGGRAHLQGKEVVFAEALLAMANDSLPTACGLYKRVTETDDQDFVAWYSLANCLYRDDAVIRDSNGQPRFRAGRHTAAHAYVQALELLKSAHKGWSSDLFSQLRRVLVTSDTRLRYGREINPPHAEYAAFPSLVNDTLAFVPVPLSAIRSGLAYTVPPTLREALDRQRDLFVSVARTWTSAFPNSAEAHLAMAVGLDLKGDAAAVDTLRRALAYARDPGLREYLTALEVLFLVKNAFPDDVAGLRRAGRLADSLQSASPAGSEHNSENMAAIAMLTGNVARAAAYYERANFKRGPRASIENLAHRLIIFATAGAPADSIEMLARKLESELTQIVVDTVERSFMRDEWLVRAATLAYPAIHKDIVGHSAADYLFSAQIAALNGHTDQARAALTALRDLRRAWPMSVVTFDAIYPEAALFAELGDRKVAIEWLDASLGSLHSVSPELFADPIRAGALIRAALLRADLAMESGDAVNARRYARAVLSLWQKPDDELGKFVQTLKRFVK